MTRKRRLPRAVNAAQVRIGANLKLWRALNRQSLTAVSAASGVSVSTIRRLEQGDGASLENLLRIARTVPIMEQIVNSTDPWEHDRGRALASNRIETRR